MGFITSLKTGISGLVHWFTHRSLVIKVVIGVLIILLGYFLVTRIFLGKSAAPQYQTAVVEKGTLVTNVTASGTISSGNRVGITTSATGIVSEVYVQNGDSVSAGQKIADITPDQNAQQKQAAAYASYLAAQNSLNAAKSKMNSLQSALFKANQAFVNDAGTQNPDTSDPKYIEENADWQQAQADYTNQQGVISQAEASLSSAWLSYAQVSSTITAPTSGTITNLSLTPGQVISSGQSTASSDTSTPNSGSSTSYGTITINQGTPQAVVNLSEVDVTKVRVGQRATLTLDAFTDKTFTGTVTAINTSGSVVSNVTTYPATITFDSGEADIYPNMAVSAQIITDVKNDVLLVPSSAITGTGDNATVRVLKNGQAQTVNVTTGASNDTQTEITSGLSEGDTVVTSTFMQSQTSGRTGATTSPFGGGGFGGGTRIFTGGGAGGFGGGARGGR